MRTGLVRHLSALGWPFSGIQHTHWEGLGGFRQADMKQSPREMKWESCLQTMYRTCAEHGREVQTPGCICREHMWQDCKTLATLVSSGKRRSHLISIGWLGRWRKDTHLINALRRCVSFELYNFTYWTNYTENKIDQPKNPYRKQRKSQCITANSRAVIFSFFKQRHAFAENSELINLNNTRANRNQWICELISCTFVWTCGGFLFFFLQDGGVGLFLLCLPVCLSVDNLNLFLHTKYGKAI